MHSLLFSPIFFDIIITQCAYPVFSFWFVSFQLRHKTNKIMPCGRWGEVEIEKGPVDLFPTEPTDEATLWRGDLEPWVQGTPRH